MDSGIGANAVAGDLSSSLSWGRAGVRGNETPPTKTAGRILQSQLDRLPESGLAITSSEKPIDGRRTRGRKRIGVSSVASPSPRPLPAGGSWFPLPIRLGEGEQPQFDRWRRRAAMCAPRAVARLLRMRASLGIRSARCYAGGDGAARHPCRLAKHAWTPNGATGSPKVFGPLPKSKAGFLARGRIRAPSVPGGKRLKNRDGRGRVGCD